MNRSPRFRAYVRSPQLRTCGHPNLCTRSAISCREQVQQTAPSFDDLIGTQENRPRKGQTNDPGGLEVDDQLKLGGLLDRQIQRGERP